MPKVFITPRFQEEDRGDGGIRRVVEAQRKWLPTFGWGITESPHDADVVATHAGVQVDVPATTPMVAHCHGLYWYGFPWQAWALKMNRDVIKNMRRADVVTSPSKWVAHAIARGTNLTTPVLYHGINEDEWPEPDYDDHDGYALWNKTRVDPICDSRPVLELAQRAPNHKFVMTLFWSKEESPADNIQVTGVLAPQDARAYVKHAGVYLCTTRETFGIGTIEAMAAGVPILGWDWGGQAEIVDHRDNGWLAKPGDYNSLVEGLEYCLANRERLGRNAREKVLRDFTWSKAMEKYAVLYSSLLARPTSPRVSVVIPAYNMEAFLEDSLKSVVTNLQGLGYDDLEVVIVDDASTDGTGAIAERWGTENFVKVIHNETNQYLAETLNIGIRASTGRYVIPLDADNMLAPNSLKLLADALDKDRDTSIAYGAMSVIEPNREEWVSSWPPQLPEFRRQMKHQNQVPSTSMYRRRVWERVGGYRRRCRTAEDADFWCRAMSFGAAAKKVTDAVVLRYRNREDSMSHVVEDWGWDVWYPWGRKAYLTPWLAPVDDERDNPTVPMHEFSMVSVVIPVGPGHERYVLDALDSVRSQTFLWWEAIVANDTGAPLRDIPPWVRVVDTGGHRGAGAARNAGMAVAKGESFLFLDADDYLQPEALELMVSEQHRAGGFVYSDWFKQESGEVYRAPEWATCADVLRELLWPVTCLYPMAAWKATRGFDTSLPAWEDWDFAIQVVEAGFCGTRVAAPLFHYRIYTGSRREEGFANREALKQEILNRWGHYITGGKQMPCGCSGGGGLPSLPAWDTYARSSSPVPIEAADEGTTLIEFVGETSAPITYTGSVTNTRYKFGSDDDHKVRHVYNKDVPRFLDFAEFRRYNAVDTSPALAAAGPPP